MEPRNRNAQKKGMYFKLVLTLSHKASSSCCYLKSVCLVAVFSGEMQCFRPGQRKVRQLSLELVCYPMQIGNQKIADVIVLA